MKIINDNSKENFFKRDNTGKIKSEIDEYKRIVYPFDKYEVVVKVDNNNEFIGIEEIRVNKSFIKYKSSVPKGYHDVDGYYKD